MSTSALAVNDAPKSVKRFDELPPKQGIEAMKGEFAKCLPAHITADRFCRVAANALMDAQVAKVAETPVGRKSIYDACLKAAADGLLLDKKEAALVKFNTKVGNTWTDVVQYMPMVQGIMKKARNSGEIKAIFADVVYAGDTFTVRMVTDGCPIDHEPRLGDRGALIGVYAVALLKDGSWTKPEIMDKGQIDAIRQRSQTGADFDRQGKAREVSGPWATDYNEMARKTVIRRAAKYWPSSTDKDDWHNVVNDYATEAADIDAGRITVQEQKKPAAAALLSSVIDDDPEVIDGDAQPQDEQDI